MRASQTAIITELEQLRTKLGRFEAHDVVTFARANPQSAIATHFNFEDVMGAAEQHWLDVARQVIKIYYIEWPQHAKQTYLIPMLQSVPDNTGHVAYESIVNIMTDKDKTHALVLRALKQARGVLSNVPHVVTQRLVKAIDKELAKL